MRRLAALCTVSLVFAAGCRDSQPGTADTGPDAGPRLPDARIIDPQDRDSGSELTEPTIVSVSPGSGPETGGTRVVLRGTSFTEPTEVFFGGTPATNVVVLDEVSVAATTPAGPVGPVTIRVTTSGGEAELPAGFTYHRELVIDAVEPARVPEEGGVPVTIVGRGFDEDTLVFFDRKPLRGARLIDAEHIEGHVPALEPGRPDVRALNREASARRADVLFVFGTPSIHRVLPGHGPILGGATQELSGDGFEGTERVGFGVGQGTDLALLEGERIFVVSPPVAPGYHDVTVANRDATGTLTDGYIVYDPTAAGLAIFGVVPRRLPAGDDQVVTIVGNGFEADAVALVDGRRSGRVDVEKNALTIILPPGLGAGPHDVVVSSGAGVATASAAFQLVEPILVQDIAPAAGSVLGGETVIVTGSGFHAGVDLRIADVPLADLVVVSETELTGRLVAGVHGTHDVVVQDELQTGVLQDAFSFSEPFEVIRVDPDEGSVAGNTYVSIFGRGLDLPATVRFGGVEGRDLVQENGGIIGVRTEPASIGRVNVEVDIDGNQEMFEDAYRFYDPRLLTGGVWGGEIEGSVNVAVQTFQGVPLPNLVVQLGYDADPRYAWVTNEDGLATVSRPDILGAQTVTVGAPGVQFVTMTEVNARNITLFVTPYPRPPGPDDPVAPCPEPGMPPVVRGKVFRFKSSLDPVTRPGWQPVAIITYTQQDIFTPNPPEPLMPPFQRDQVFNDGEEWEIAVLRPGTVAVYAILYDFNTSTQEAIPRRMGIVRNIPASAGQVVEDVNIELNIALDQSTVIRLDSPPEQVPGPSINAVFPFLNLQSDGVIPFNPVVVNNNQVFIDNLPAVAESQFFYMGGSFTIGDTALVPPWSLSFLESGRPFEEGVDVGPFLQMPQNVSPKPLQLVEGGVMSWTQGGVTPDITVINVTDSIAIGGRCCMDTNGNGQCDPGEEIVPLPAFPQGYNRWTIFAEGGRQSYAMPRMISGVNAFETPRDYPWGVQTAIAPRFNYREFTYNELLSPFFWRSWTVSGYRFLVKEETD